MSFLSAVISTIRFVYSLLIAWTTNQTLVGSLCLLDWADEKEEYQSNTMFYVSFSPPPQIYGDLDLEMDDFGMMDDDVFCYSTPVEFLKRLWTRGDEGWKVNYCRQIIVAETLE
jgi:hypothetical protein